MQFVNTLAYINKPIEEFADFRYVSWEKEIYPVFKGSMSSDEAAFFASFIRERGLKRIIDFGVGGGLELSGILRELDRAGYAPEAVEANEVDEEFVRQAEELFAREGRKVRIHTANWLDLPAATPPYEGRFDFGFLTGNSLTYIGGGTREHTRQAQQSVVSKFATLIEPGGYFFIDMRNYDYIRSLIHLPREEMFRAFSFEKSVYYHGFGERIVMFPAYISDTVVVAHYYDRERRVWSKLDFYPIYQEDMRAILSRDFEIERVFHDFEEGEREKSLFVQYLARKRG